MTFMNTGYVPHTRIDKYLFTTQPHPPGHWELQELLGNHILY